MGAADREKLQADAAAVAGAVAGDAVTDELEAAELFDVDMDHFAGVLALVAADRLGPVKRLHLVQPPPFENPADGGRRDAPRPGALPAAPAPAAPEIGLSSGRPRGGAGEGRPPPGNAATRPGG